MPHINIKQAYIPEGGVVIPNKIGTAPGFIIKKDTKALIVMPGVPKEMVLMLNNKVLGYLKERIGKTKKLISSTITIYGKGESFIASKLSAIEKKARKDGIEIGYIAQYGAVSIRVEGCNSLKVASYTNKIKKALPFYIDESGKPLEVIIGEKLRARRKTISIAESCTGGLISKIITDVPGSSAYFMAGYVAYSNSIKMTVLSVKKETLNKFGAVSEQCAIEMARGAKRLSDSDFAIAVTGIAGPSGGSSQKPVGTIFICLINDRDRVIVEKRFFTGDRELIRHKSMREALILLLNAPVSRKFFRGDGGRGGSEFLDKR